MLGKILKIIGTLTLVILIVLCLSVSVPRLLGFNQYVVVSGSMEPAIPVGSMVFSKEVDPSQLETGDVIVFYTELHSDTPVTHRVVENNTAAGEVVTKGDANSANDLSPIPYANIEGKVSYHVPRLGFLAAPFGTPIGKISILMFIVAGYLLTLIGSNMEKGK